MRGCLCAQTQDQGQEGLQRPRCPSLYRQGRAWAGLGSILQTPRASSSVPQDSPEQAGQEQDCPLRRQSSPRLQGDEKVPGRPTAQDTSESPGGGGRIRGWTHASSTPKLLPATCTLSSTHHGCVFNTLSPSYIHEWPSSMDWREYLSENVCCLMWEYLRTL